MSPFHLFCGAPKMSIIVIFSFGFQLFHAFKETRLLLTELIPEQETVYYWNKSPQTISMNHIYSESRTTVSAVSLKALKCALTTGVFQRPPQIPTNFDKMKLSNRQSPRDLL